MRENQYIPTEDVFGAIDWGEAWRSAHQNRLHHDDPSYWDGRAASFCGATKNSEYIYRFIDLMQIQPEETVLDVGCGNGALALPLAQAGHQVTGVDFSSKMLERLRIDAQKSNISTTPICIQASWDDDWEAEGIPTTDVVIASRSLAVNDLYRALSKLNSFAKRRVCITVPTSHSPRYSKELWDAVGRTPPTFRDHIYAMNILFQMGLMPELRYIRSTKWDRYQSFDEACTKSGDALGKMTEAEEKRFESFCEKHIVMRTDEAGETYWTRDYQRKTSWAFISWDITSA